MYGFLRAVTEGVSEQPRVDGLVSKLSSVQVKFLQPALSEAKLLLQFRVKVS